MSRSNSTSTRTDYYPEVPFNYRLTYFNNHSFHSNNSNTNLLDNHRFNGSYHQRTESSETFVSSTFSSESEESDSGSRVKRPSRGKIKQVKAQKARDTVGRPKVQSNIAEVGYIDSNGVPVILGQSRVKKNSGRMGGILKKLKFWKKDNNDNDQELPIAIEMKDKRKKKSDRGLFCCIIILIIIIILLLANIIALDAEIFSRPNNSATIINGKDGGNKNGGNEGNGNGGSFNNSAPLTPEDLRVKSLVCLALFGSVGSTTPKQFSCEFCTDDPNVFYNVSTFCALKSIWANAVNQSAFEQNLRWMQNNEFCEWGGISCDNSQRIISLNMLNPNIPSALPEDIGNLVTLQNLSITGNGPLPNEQIPATIFQLPNLISLNIVSTGLTGLPDTINNMTSLKTLFLSKNPKLGNSIPPSIGLSSLTSLTMSGQGITGSIPDFLGNSKNLRSSLQNMDLSFNSVTGNIPQSLMNLVSMKFLILHGNQLKGSIPSIGSSNFPGLNNLDLGNNSLTGTIPDSISTLNNLASLILTSNGLTGNIPSSITNLKSLRDLDLSGNKFSGSIPTGIGNMPLNTLDLARNTLTGTIPGGICQKNYIQCDLSSNSFSSTGQCGQCNL